jgi:hypothetical protein
MSYIYSQTYDCKCPCGWTYSASSTKGMFYRLGLHRKYCDRGGKSKINEEPAYIKICDSNFKVIKTKLDPTKNPK